jgi:hypothetical protein
VSPPVSVPISIPPISVPPATTPTAPAVVTTVVVANPVGAAAPRCTGALAKVVQRRAQLANEVAGLTNAEASARSAGRTVEADFLRLEIARAQREEARVALDLQRRQALCAGVPASVQPVDPMPVPVTIQVPPSTVAIPPACRGAKGQIRSTSVHIRNESRKAARALADSIRARSRGEVARADKKLAEATKREQRIARLTARHAALVNACPSAV